MPLGSPAKTPLSLTHWPCWFVLKGTGAEDREAPSACASAPAAPAVLETQAVPAEPGTESPLFCAGCGRCCLRCVSIVLGLSAGEAGGGCALGAAVIALCSPALFPPLSLFLAPLLSVTLCPSLSVCVSVFLPLSLSVSVSLSPTPSLLSSCGDVALIPTGGNIGFL